MVKEAPLDLSVSPTDRSSGASFTIRSETEGKARPVQRPRDRSHLAHRERHRCEQIPPRVFDPAMASYTSSPRWPCSLETREQGNAAAHYSGHVTSLDGGTSGREEIAGQAIHWRNHHVEQHRR